jgi:hypothetical protein
MVHATVSELALSAGPHATVYDSARTAAEVYRTILSSFAAMRQSREPSSFEAIFFEKLTGDALIDPETDENPPPPDAPRLPQLNSTLNAMSKKVVPHSRQKNSRH